MYQNILVPISLDVDRDTARTLQVAQVLNSDDDQITFLHVVEHLPQYTNNLLPIDHLECVKAVASEKLTPFLNGFTSAWIEIVDPKLHVHLHTGNGDCWRIGHGNGLETQGRANESQENPHACHREEWFADPRTRHLVSGG